MRESPSVGRAERYVFDGVTEKDLEVGHILLDLEDAILELEYRKLLSVNWGAKRKRSTANDFTNPSPPRRLRSPPCLQPRSNPDEAESEIRPHKVKAAEATSPSTPFSFFPSESDHDKFTKDHSQSLKKISKKKTGKELQEIIDGLTQHKELLTREVDNVKGYYNKLMAFNLVLKAKRAEVNYCLIMQNNRGLNLGMKMDQQQYPASVFDYQQTSFTNQLSGQLQYYPNGQIAPSFSSSRSSGLTIGNQAGPHVLPDLNICAEDNVGVVVDSSWPFHMNEKFHANFKAAEARRRRMIKINEKKNSLADRKIIY